MALCRGFSNDWGVDVGVTKGSEALAGLGQEEEAGDQVVFGGIPTRPSSASTSGRPTFDVSIRVELRAASNGGKFGNACSWELCSRTSTAAYSQGLGVKPYILKCSEVVSVPSAAH